MTIASSTTEVPSTAATARVLVVDDDPLLADLVGEWVREKWTCETVNGGADALDALGAGSEGDGPYDVVVLDRQMPGVSGEDVLATIREQGLTTQVLMVSAVTPDLDLVDLPVDDYLQKPVDRPTLQERIEQLLLRRTYLPPVERYFVCAAKLATLEATMTAAELAANERYLELRTTADELRQSADATLGEMSDHVAGMVG